MKYHFLLMPFLFTPNFSGTKPGCNRRVGHNTLPTVIQQQATCKDFISEFVCSVNWNQSNAVTNIRYVI